jgi:uncharacterized protein (DUF305 family)
MKKLTLRRFSIASALVFSSASLTGCSLDLGDAIGAVVSQFSGGDVMFAQMMIKHHEQAVEMGKLAGDHAASSEVKALAADIVAEQAPEIAQMKAWLTEAGSPLEAVHSMAMDGMLSGAQMTALSAATGEAFDKLFLNGMIAHHKGAITMAKLVVDSGNEEVAKLASAVIDSQTKQIERMEALLAK